MKKLSPDLRMNSKDFDSMKNLELPMETLSGATTTSANMVLGGETSPACVHWVLLKPPGRTSSFLSGRGWREQRDGWKSTIEG